MRAAPSDSATLAAPGTSDEALLRIVESAGLIPAETLARARTVRDETGERIDAILTRLGMLSEQKLAEALAHATALPIAARDSLPTQALDLADLSPRYLREARLLPFRRGDGTLALAMADPLDGDSRAAVEMAIGATAQPVVATATDIEAAIDRCYGVQAESATDGDDEADDADLDRLKDLASDAPAIRAVNRLITRAVETRASDIHLEPTEDSVVARLRIDGVLRELDPLPGAMKASLVSRIKIMANLNIAERRLPQDGRMRFTVRGQDIDLRVATSPTINGESVVMRLLDRSHLKLSFDALGFDDELTARLRHALASPHGIMLVTGPTGSGKTTTLYTALSELNTTERKLLTVEDPIEYRLPGVCQTQIAPAIGLDFAAALRSFLRQDPDVIMVGEIRDLETAQVAVQAALTGHLILSTLHTNTAASAVTRLLDMGVEPFLITSTVNAVLAQRLVRLLCPSCRTSYEPPDEVLEEVAGAEAHRLGIRQLYHAVGCTECGGSGYRGRIALLELIVVDDTIARLALERAEAREIEAAARAAGMRSMAVDGLMKAAAGLTTPEEVLRVIREG